MKARRPLVAANWKMHLLRRDAERYCATLRRRLKGHPGDNGDGVEVALFPSFPLIPTVAGALAGSAVSVGGQDLHPEPAGAHTGDVSAPQLIDAGCAWVLCGHSERRRDHGETDALVRRKLAAAWRHGLRAILCVGESAGERRAGETFPVLERQLRAALNDGQHGPLALAYEPVWAIGTGETATPEIAQEAHAHLRRLLGELLGEARAARMRILYGGSVKPENAAPLIARADIDGFLVGGASLDAETFSTIIGICGSAAP